MQNRSLYVSMAATKMDAGNACAAINPCQACSGLLHFSGLLININWCSNRKIVIAVCCTFSRWFKSSCYQLTYKFRRGHWLNCNSDYH